MRSQIIFLFFAILIHLFADGNTRSSELNPDSLVVLLKTAIGEEKINTLNLIAAGLVNSNPDKALEYATDALNYAHETKYVEQKAFA
nr:hypothetical protein [Bacteroidota bacterium]